MTVVRGEIYELSSSEFERLVGRHLAFMTEEFRFPSPCFWDFAGTCHVSFESEQVRIVTWCGKRDDSVWTTVEDLATGRLLGLDTLNSLLGAPFEYPPDTGWYWTRDDVESRVALEASILRAHLPDVLSGQRSSMFEELGAYAEPESISLDDPVATFPRRCIDRFSFLEQEYQLTPEFDGMGAGVLYRGIPRSVRIALLEEMYEREDEAQPTLSAEIANSPDGKVAPPYMDSLELEIREREGPFTAEYLESSFDHLERELREHLPPKAGGHGA